MQEKIAVLMGGRSLEREVSLASGKRVLHALEGLGYRTLALDLTPDLVDSLRSEKPDAVYIALHGKLGEDGTIQELLEFLGIPYTGPGVLASAQAWDKALSKRIFAENGVPTPAWLTFSADAFKEMGAATALSLVPEKVGGFPLIVKPAEQGSGLGLSKVERAEDLAEALLGALSYSDKAIVEQWIDGCEIAVAVLEGPTGLEMLPVVEMVAKSGLFDFQSMYTVGATDYYVPARLDEGGLREVLRVAGLVHTLLGCRDVSRVDMVVGKDGVPYVLEANTSPGMTESSLLPMAAESAEMPLSQVVERLVTAALGRRADG